MEQAKNLKTFPQKVEVIHNGSRILAKILQTFLSDLKKIVDNSKQVYNRDQSSTKSAFKSPNLHCSTNGNSISIKKPPSIRNYERRPKPIMQFELYNWYCNLIKYPRPRVL